MTKKREIKKNRVIIYYIIVIVIPCIILGILAFRGIKNDQALIEKEQNRLIQEAGNEIIIEIENFLRSKETEFKEQVENIYSPDKALFSDSVLSSFISNNPELESVFYFSDKNSISLLDKCLIFKPDNLEQNSSGNFPERTYNIMEEGWRLEYAQNDFAKAIEYYENNLNDQTSAQEKGGIYNSIARLQNKLGKPFRAIKTYDLLYATYADVYINGGLPLGMIALLESGLLYLNAGDVEQGINRIDTLVNLMLHSRWEIKYSVYANTLIEIGDIITSYSNNNIKNDNVLQSTKILLDAISEKEKKTEYLLTLIDDNNIFQSNLLSVSDFNHRFYFEINGNSYFGYLTKAKTPGDWGLIYNLQYLEQNVINKAIQKVVNRYDFGCEIINDEGIVSFRSENLTTSTEPVSIVFPASLPYYTVMIYPKNQGFLNSVIHINQGIFFYIFLFIIIILACGLLLIIYTVNNELQLSKMKSNFISTVSHEFKSPLTLIRQMAEMLQNNRVPTEERKHKYYSAMLQESERLTHLIENILDFSKMEAGRKEFLFENGNLGSLVDELLSSVKNHYMDKGFQINYILSSPVPDSVFDKESMMQVLQNLVDNACKYSGDSKKIEIKLSHIRSELVLTVKDFGIGIKKDEQDKIFSRFYRAGNELTQKVKGSGIGLTIVKQIVSAHNGRIEVKSEPGKGSDFQIHLPIKMDLNNE